MKQRRAFSTWGGPVQTRGDADLLARAMRARAGGFTHDFHAYPARMPPGIARTLLDRGVVFDPFCGSGTVLVEAAVKGCRAIGRDLNPLAVRLSRLKTSLRPLRLADVERAARRAAALVRSRRQNPPPESARTDFAPNVAWELAALRDACDSDALRLVLSSMLVKFSRRDGDKRIPDGRALRFFVGRGCELVDGLAEFARAVPAGTPPVDVEEGDARDIRDVDGIDVVLTSPPYGDTYHYGVAARLSLDWLDLKIPVNEIRASSYARDMRRVFAGLARVVKPGGRLYMVTGQPLDAGAGWTFTGEASQPRPVTGSREYLIAWRRAG